MCDEYRKEDCVTINVNCGKDHGHHHHCKCPAAYLNMYSLLAQPLASAAAALFEAVGVDSGDFDVSQANISGEVKIMKKGVYVINWGANAALQTLAFPVPAWGFALYLNGAAVPGSGAGACSITPDEVVTHTSGLTLLELQVGDLLKLVNISNQAVATISAPVGLIQPIASVAMNINLIKELM